MQAKCYSVCTPIVLLKPPSTNVISAVTPDAKSKTYNGQTFTGFTSTITVPSRDAQCALLTQVCGAARVAPLAFLAAVAGAALMLVERARQPQGVTAADLWGLALWEHAALFTMAAFELLVPDE